MVHADLAAKVRKKDETVRGGSTDRP